MKILIIGGVAGGATAAARARRESEEAEITLVERGPYISFANCGLPYFIGGAIKSKSDLMLQTPQSFWNRYRVKVLVNTNALSIDRVKKIVTISDVNGIRALSYDKLIISQGANPIVPQLPGGDSQNVFSLRDIKDMDRIDQYIETEKPKTAVIIGGGFIGIEMAEALSRRGIEVVVVEKGPQVMSLMDQEFGLMVRNELHEHNIKTQFNTAVISINGTEKTVKLDNGSKCPAEIVFFSIGVSPELSIAKAAGLKIGTQGGLVVDQYLATSDHDIFAVGDMIEIQHRVAKKNIRVPLAGPANRQGRIAAHNALIEKKMTYGGALGSSVIKVFEKTAASTGLSERVARMNGLNIDTATVHPRNHAGYYPGSTRLTLKLIFEKTTGQIIGAQAFGESGTEKRIDVLATAIAGKMTVMDLAELDLCYAPPYSSANDPVNMVGFVASNIIDGFTQSISAQDFLNIYKLQMQSPGTNLETITVLDVRDQDEVKLGAVPGSVNIPLPQLRDNLQLLDKHASIYVHCAVGFRGHIAYRILIQNGFTKVKNISGGYKSIELFTDL